MSLFDDLVGYGTHAARPPAGRVGALYFESDTGNGYRDNGTGWDQILRGGGGAATVMHTSTDLVLTQANVLVVLQADGLKLTLPDAAATAGQAVHTTRPRGTGYHVDIYYPAGTVLIAANDAIFNYYSDGTTWLDADF